MADPAAGRLAPLAPEAWDGSLADIRARLGTPLNIHKVIARHPAPMRGWIGLRDRLTAGSSFEPRLRELLIPRVAHGAACACEWDRHVLRGRAAGLGEAEIGRARAGPEAPGWTEGEAHLLRAADEMLAAAEISPATRSGLCAAFDDAGLLDIVFTVGACIVMATLPKTARVPHEESAPAAGAREESLR